MRIFLIYFFIFSLLDLVCTFPIFMHFLIVTRYFVPMAILQLSQFLNLLHFLYTIYNLKQRSNSKLHIGYYFILFIQSLFSKLLLLCQFQYLTVCFRQLFIKLLNDAIVIVCVGISVLTVSVVRNVLCVSVVLLGFVILGVCFLSRY